MKKVFLSLIAVLMTFFAISNVSALEKPKVTKHEKVTIYIFRGNGCPHCSDAIKYFNELGDEYSDYFEVKTYETWYNENNNKLGKAVAEKFDYDFSGVPFIVVGEEYVGGFGSSTGEKLVNLALDAYQDKDYKDVVKETLKEINYETVETSIEEALKEESQTNQDTNQNTNQVANESDTSSSKNDALIIIGLFVILIGGIAGLVVVGKK